MASVLSHLAVPLALGVAVGAERVPARLALAGVVCCILPDLDVIAFHAGISYASPFGHRGASHSLAFAALIALAGAALRRRLGARALATFAFLFVSTASHGVLDAMTNGGLGIAFCWPWSEARLFLPFRPIEVSPIGLQGFLGPRGLRVLRSEGIWIWCPALLLAIAGWRWRRLRT